MIRSLDGEDGTSFPQVCTKRWAAGGCEPPIKARCWGINSGAMGTLILMIFGAQQAEDEDGIAGWASEGQAPSTAL